MSNHSTKTLRNQTSDFPDTDDGSPNLDGASSGFVSAPTDASDMSGSGSELTTQTRILRLPEVMRRTGFGRSSIYSYLLEGTFPAALKLGERAVGWRECDIEAWIASRPVATHAYRATK
jgi:prophage regulatory protein